jgi:hypothetical protein
MGTEGIDNALERVLSHIDSTITRNPEEWALWPGGWPGQIGTALVDAVYSARATYSTKHGRGVLPLVQAWRTRAVVSRSSLVALIKEIEAEGPHPWAVRFGNEQHSPRRSAYAPGGPWKSAAVLEAAINLRELSIDSAAGITDENSAAVKAALRSVQGIGFATTNYFLILLGRPGVKPDRMVHRFLWDATCQNWTNAQANDLVVAAAAQIGTGGVPPHEIDHAIWSFESRKAAKA